MTFCFKFADENFVLCFLVVEENSKKTENQIKIPTIFFCRIRQNDENKNTKNQRENSYPFTIYAHFIENVFLNTVHKDALLH